MQGTLDVKRRAPLAFHSQNSPHPNQGQPVQEIGVSLKVHVPKQGHEPVDYSWRQAVEFVDEEDYRTVKQTIFFVKNINPSSPVFRNLDLQSKSVSHQMGHPFQ